MNELLIEILVVGHREYGYVHVPTHGRVFYLSQKEAYSLGNLTHILSLYGYCWW